MITTESPDPCSILSLDIGKKRIGLAGCDPLGITVKVLPALKRQSFQQDLEIFKSHCNTRKVKGLVIGLPLDANGCQTQQARFCQRYGQRIALSLGLPIAWVNEHSSTWAAEVRFNLKKDKSGELDSAAAALLLEQWLREGPELQPVDLTTPIKTSHIQANSGI